MSKKLIIITLGLGLLSFAGTFAFAFFKKPPQISSPNEPEQPANVLSEAEIISQQLAMMNTTGPAATAPVDTTKSMAEQQLKNLIHDLRKKMQDYDNKLQSLNTQEQRLQMARDVLKEDLEKLHSLQIELASITANLKSEREQLLKTRIEIDKNEQTNLLSIAATYDKMDAGSASKIITNMCSNETSGTKQSAQNEGVSKSDDAVKILYYMSERTKAKLLAELATSEPQLASVLSRRLKQIVEAN
ncbi:MAG: hypothetical protein JW715_15985 [Sedimentisphaerales bacterium]|nr:hypothetical protein [Sedimentisphaerales bacterium]